MEYQKDIIDSEIPSMNVNNNRASTMQGFQ